MLAGVKIVSRDQVLQQKEHKSDDSRSERRKSRSKKKKERRRKSSSGYDSSEDEGLEKIKKGSRKKKWYASDESISSSASESSDGESSDEGPRKGKGRRKEKRRKRDKNSKDKADIMSKKKSRRSNSSSEDNSESEEQCRIGDDELTSTTVEYRVFVSIVIGNDGENFFNADEVNIIRREMGLDWMTRPAYKVDNNASQIPGEKSEDPPKEELKVGNSRELNPYLQVDGTGYPEDGDQIRSGGSQLLSSSLVGDGGASWRLKALKRAKEQAEREGKKLEEVAEERWGSLGNLAVSVVSHNAAPSRAHLHAIKSRKSGLSDDHASDSSKQGIRNADKNTGLDDSKRTPVRHPDMRAPKLHNSFSWGRRKTKNSRDADLISSAVASLNKFENDGSFLQKVMTVKNESIDFSGDKLDKISEAIPDSKMDLLGKRPDKDTQPLSANQLAAKALQLRIKGQHEEADKLMKEAESVKSVGEKSHRPRAESSRYAMQVAKARQKKDEDDSDMHLAQRITKNKKFSVSGQADDEYDYDDDAPSKRDKKKGVRDEKASLVSKQSFSRHIMTQKERCQYCFENPNRPKHLVVAIANFTYLMLPQWQPVAAGHCCILPLQHEASTRSVDDNVWEEIRNFKKCLIMMFAKQEKDVVFLETVVGLAQQRRHCMIECIPLPQEIAKEAPLYFKKAIDEAEDEWSQHNAKKLIDTSQKGLRGSIPKNFPYFHVEFGLNRGFVHVIDDEKEFKTSLGLNVIRGMLQLSEEDMYRRRRYESVESQKQAVASFSREWDPFDWTKQLA
ncbi:CWF19-like protein [Drosera capensis]